MKGMGLSSGPVLFTVFGGKTVNPYYSRESSSQHSRAVRLGVNAGYFSDTAEGVISTTWGSPSPIKQALKHFEDSLR